MASQNFSPVEHKQGSWSLARRVLAALRAFSSLPDRLSEPFTRPAGLPDLPGKKPLPVAPPRCFFVVEATIISPMPTWAVAPQRSAGPVPPTQTQRAHLGRQELPALRDAFPNHGAIEDSDCHTQNNDLALSRETKSPRTNRGATESVGCASTYAWNYTPIGLTMSSLKKKGCGQSCPGPELTAGPL